MLSARPNQNKILQLSKIVKTLGVNQEEVAQDFDALADDPHASVALLVSELHPIPCKVYYNIKKTEESQHVINCLRALRYLTGLTFTAKTSQVLADDARQFLDFNKQMHDDNPEHKIHFFGVWMSRDADFVAPRDAQLSIINQWRKWQRQYGNSFKYVPAKKAAEAMDEWYWWG